MISESSRNQYELSWRYVSRQDSALNILNNRDAVGNRSPDDHGLICGQLFPSTGCASTPIAIADTTLACRPGRFRAYGAWRPDWIALLCKIDRVIDGLGRWAGPTSGLRISKESAESVTEMINCSSTQRGARRQNPRPDRARQTLARRHRSACLSGREVAEEIPKRGFVGQIAVEDVDPAVFVDA